MRRFSEDRQSGLDPLQQAALSLMAVIAVITFLGTNVQALLWQSSDWLVGTVLPAVVVDLTNEERGGYAAAPLTRSAVLDAAATKKAEHMAEHQYFAHFAPDGTTPWQFFAVENYVYAHAGENLAVHFTDSTEVVTAWMNSPAHKENIVNGDFTEIGVGTARGSYDGYDTVFVVQLFGTPAQPVEGPESEEISTPLDQIAPETAPVPAVTTSTDELAALRVQVEALQARTADLSLRTLPVASSTAAALTDVLGATAEYSPTTALTSTTPELAIISPNVVFSSQVATSSGLPVRAITEPTEMATDTHAGATISAVMTKPNVVLDVMYSLLVSAVLVLLSIALWGEARRFHYLQVVYSLLLLAGVGGLWSVHTLLTSGAVVA